MKVFIDESTLNYQLVEKFVEDQIGIINLTDMNNKIDFRIVENHLKLVNNCPNIYCLYTRIDQVWNLIYVGQRKRGAIRARLRQHLIKKHVRTGSKLQKISNHLENGFSMGLKTISIDPDELRQYYENKLIMDFKPVWNIHR